MNQLQSMCQNFSRNFVNAHGDNSEFVDITSAIDALRRCPAGLDPILEETLPSGVAYLTMPASQYFPRLLSLVFFVLVATFACFLFIIVYKLQ